MRLRDSVSEQTDMIELARAPDTAVGRIYKRLIEERVGEVLGELRRRPKVNSTDVHDDVRYKFGLMDGLEYVLKLSEQALEEISKPVKERE